MTARASDDFFADIFACRRLNIDDAQKATMETAKRYGRTCLLFQPGQDGAERCRGYEPDDIPSSSCALIFTRKPADDIG